MIIKIISGRIPGCNPVGSSADPLLVTTRLLSDALTRLRIFVFGLDPMQWLSWRDRNVLYTSQICCLAILKASVGVGMLPCNCSRNVVIIVYFKVYWQSLLVQPFHNGKCGVSL